MNTAYIITILICILCGYLLGSVNSSLIVGKYYKTDVRRYGSGNAGTTNVLRTLGKKAALFTFSGDFLKGITACLVGKCIILIVLSLFGNKIFGNVVMPENIGLMTAGAFCVFGHNWPVFFGFKGGKGVLTTFAVFLMMALVPALITMFFFIIIALFTRYISLASILSAVFLPLFIYTALLFDINTGVESTKRFMLFCIPLSLLIIIKHRKNISKLIKGTENKLGRKAEVE